MTLRDSVLTGIRWTAGLRVVSQLFSWFGSIIVIRLLAPDDYGILTIGGFFILYLLLLSEGGLSDALVRQPKLTDRMLEEVQGVLLIVSSACCALLALGAPLIASYFDEPRLSQVLPVLAVQFLIVGVGVIPQALLMRDMRFRTLSSIQLAQAVVATLVTLGLALLGAGVWALVASNLIGLLYKSGALIAAARRFHRPRFQFSQAKVFTGFSGYVLVDRTVWHLFANVDALIVSKLLGTTATGIYAVSHNLASLPVTKVAGVLGQVAMAAFSKIQEDAKRVYASYLLAMRAIAVCSFAVGFGLAAVAEPVVKMVLGPMWLDAIPIFQVLAFAIPFRLLSSFDAPLLMALGWPQVMLQNRLISLLVLSAALLVASRYGLLGIASAWAIGAPAIWIATTARFCRKLAWPLGQVLQITVVPVFAATGMFGSVAALQWSNALVAEPPALQLALLIPLGGVVYAGLMWLLGRQSLEDVLRLLRGLILERRFAH